MNGRGNKLSKLRTQKQSKENIINDIRNLFILKKEKQETKGRIIRDIRILSEDDDDE